MCPTQAAKSFDLERVLPLTVYVQRREITFSIPRMCVKFNDWLAPTPAATTAATTTTTTRTAVGNNSRQRRIKRSLVRIEEILCSHKSRSVQIQGRLEGDSVIR